MEFVPFAKPHITFTIVNQKSDYKISQKHLQYTGKPGQAFSWMYVVLRKAF